jgi:hypothetical protein
MFTCLFNTDRLMRPIEIRPATSWTARTLPRANKELANQWGGTLLRFIAYITAYALYPIDLNRIMAPPLIKWVD